MQIAQIDFQLLENFASPNLPDTLGGIIQNFIPYVFALAGLLLLFYLILGGIGLMTSGGDPKSIEASKSRITTALIGFVIVFVSYWIVQVFAILFGLDKIKQIFTR